MDSEWDEAGVMGYQPDGPEFGRGTGPDWPLSWGRRWRSKLFRTVRIAYGRGGLRGVIRFSVPATRRRMLARCLTITSAATAVVTM